MVQRLLRTIQRWQRNRAMTALQALPDMYLAEVGITRGDIPRLVDSLFPPQGPDPTGRLVSCVRPRSKSEFRNAA
jgi:uncharacterized protein YjiS (DUF1127 family)